MLLFHIDAFTRDRFKGNPAAVCLLDRERDAQWMQDVAVEMKLSATAFLLPRAGDGHSLRWFTPATEVALCGHATLASAHALLEEQLLSPDEIARFHTKSGLLTAQRTGDRIELDFPATLEERSDAPEGLLESLGVTDPVYVGRNKFDYLVEVASEEIVRALQPDHSRLRKIPARGVIVTSRADVPRSTSEYLGVPRGGSGQRRSAPSPPRSSEVPEVLRGTHSPVDFVSRFFAPGSGIDEDPVTGSAHCCLTPYWSARLGKQEMTAYQASPRGGYMRVRLDGDRVKLAGHAVTVLRGELRA